MDNELKKCTPIEFCKIAENKIYKTNDSASNLNYCLSVYPELNYLKDNKKFIQLDKEHIRCLIKKEIWE